MRKTKITRVLAAVLIACLLLTLCTVFAFAGVSVAEDEMKDIKSDFASYLVQDTRRVDYDGYVGALEYTIYYDHKAFGKAKGGFDGTSIIAYCVNTDTERVGTDSNKTIIQSMLDRGYMVAVIDYLNNPLATGHELDDSAQIVSQMLKFGNWLDESDKISDVSGWSTRYFKTYVCPSGHNVLLDNVFFEIDKHAASGTLEKIVENWNTDFKTARGENSVKWAYGDDVSTRKTVAKAADGTDPVWYNASGAVDANGLYTKVKYTVASTITDCVNPDGSALDLDLKIQVVYPTNPENEVPVLSVSCAWGYPTATEQCYTDLCSHHTGALFRGYAGAVYEYMWHPMAQDSSYGYYDGSQGVTKDHMNYSIHLYNDKLVNTASQRFLRYLALSDSTYKFDLDKFACIGLSKGGWFTFLGDSELQSGLVDNPELYSESELEAKIDEALSSFIPRRYFDGHHGETRYQAGEGGIVGGPYTGKSAIDAGEIQPWLTYNGVEIISGVQLTYASNGSQQEDITVGHVPMFIAAHMNDEYNAAYGSANDSILAAESMNIPLIYFEVDQLHEFAYTPDMFYKVSTYDAFFDFAGFYLKGEPIKVFYTDPYNGDGRISITDKIEIQFSGEATLAEVQKITVTASGETLDGVWTSSCGGTKWSFAPYRMSGNTSYTVTVPADFKGVNGVAMGEAYTAGFVTEADDAAPIAPTEGSYYALTLPESIPAGKDTVVFRFAVTNNASNIAELYAVDGVSATEGSLIGKVNLKGAGIYEIDITDFAVENVGKSVTLFLKAGKDADIITVKELDFSDNTDLVTKGQAPLELVMIDQNGNKVTSGGDSVAAIYINPRTYNAGDVNYENITAALGISKILGTSDKITDADYGRRFTITVKLFDTASRTVQLRLGHMTSSSLGIMDTQAPYHNVRTTAGEWIEYSFDYVVYDTEYGASSNVEKALYINVSPTGDTKKEIYISNIKVTETVTDMSVANAEIAYKSLGGVDCKVPEANTPLALYNGSTLVAAYSSWKEALGAYQAGYTLKLTDDYTLSDAELYSDFGTKAESIVIDLNGYTVYSENTDKSILWLKNTSTAIAKTTVTLKNGGIVLGARPIISYENSTASGAGKVFDVKLENLTVTLKTRASVTELVSASAIKPGAAAPTKVNVSVTECDFNLGDEDKRAVVMLTLFPEGKDSLDISYSVYGGSISMSHHRWITLISNSFYSKYYEGKNGYTKLYLPSAYTPSDKVSYISAEGYAKFVPQNTANNITEYTIAAGDSSTLYGVIPDAYNDAVRYPFVVFKLGAFVGAYSTWNEALSSAQTAVNGAANLASEAQIVLRRDYTNTEDPGPQLNGATNIVFDLGDNTFISEDVGLDLSASYSAAPYATNITVLNGKLLSGKIAFVDGQLFKAATGVKVYNVTFTDITFGFDSALDEFWSDMLYTPWTNVASSNGVDTNLTYENCTIDLRNYPLTSAYTVFDAKDGNNVLNVHINIIGGQILMDSANYLTFANLGTNDSLVMSKDGNGKYTTLTVEGGGAPLADSFRTADGHIMVFKETATAGLYELERNELATDYGVIPNANADAESYPFVIFKDGSFVGAYNTWSAATNAAQGAVSGAGNKDSKAIILLRRDFVSASRDTGATINGATNILIDLGGYKLTYNWVGIDLWGRYDDAPYKTAITVKNGTILNTCGMGFVDIQHTSGSAAKQFDIDFEGVTFGFAPNIDSSWSNWGQSNMLLEIWTVNAGAGTATDISFVDCTFNLRDNIPSVITESNKINIFTAADGNANASVNITVNGGNIIASTPNSLKSFNFISGDANDSLVWKKGENGYTTLTTPATKSYTNGLQYTGSFNTPEGAMYFVEMQDDGVNSVCVLDKIDFGYGAVSISPNDKHLSAVDFPFVVLMDNSFKGGYSKWHEALNRANELAAMAENAGKTVYIAQRRDYTSTQGTGYTAAKGNIVADLRGFTLSCGGGYLVDIYVNYSDSTGLGYTSSLEIRNGTFKNDRENAPMIAIGHKGTNASYDTKQFGMTFTGVTFKLSGSGATVVKEWTGGTHVGDGVNTDYLFDGCTIDLTGATAGTVIFDMQNERNAISVVFRGGKIISDNLSDITLCAVNGNDTYYFEAVGGVYTSLSQPSHIAVPNSTFKNVSGKVLSFALDKNNGLYSDYTLGEPINTPYGDIHYQYHSAEDYPFAVFDEKGNFLGAFDSLLDITDPYNNNGAINCAKNYLSGNTWSDGSYGASPRAAYIVLRRDYKFASNESYNNLAQVQGVITVDLMGFTLSAADNRVMFPSSIKPWVVTGDSSIFPTEFYFKNGNIELVNAAMINFESWKGGDNIDVSGKEFIYRFDKVNFKVTGGASNIFATTSLSGTPEAMGNPELKFNDCTFDITKAVQGATLFNLGNGLTNIKVTVCGGRIIADIKEFNIYARSENTASALVLLRGSNGKYTELVLPSGAEAPAEEIYGFKLQLTGEEGANEIYTFTPAASIDLDFTPKASVTLDSNLIFNIYVPAHAGLGTVTLNGVAVDLGEAKDGYYVISTPLAANEAARELVLTVELTANGTPLKATFTFSTVKYAEKLLTMDIIDEEKTLAKDILAYIKSAYEYFAVANRAAVIDEIDAILGAYVSDNVINTADAKCDTEGLSGATFVLGATPAIRFYLDGYTADKFSFKVGERTLNVTDANLDSDADGSYIQFTLFAYEMTETFSYVIDVEEGEDITGEYNIISYYADAVEKSNTALADIVAKFYNYCKSAYEYKLAVTNQ